MQISGPIQPHKPKKIAQDNSSRISRIEKGNQYMKSTVQASSGWRSMLPSEQLDLRMPPMSRGKQGQFTYKYIVFGGTPEALAAIEAANLRRAADKKAAEDAGIASHCHAHIGTVVIVPYRAGSQHT